MHKAQIMTLSFKRLGISYQQREGVGRKQLCRMACEALGVDKVDGSQRQWEFLSKFAQATQKDVLVLPPPKVHVQQPKKIKKAKKRGGDLNLDEFYGSSVWRVLRMVVLKEHGARCQCCGRTAKDGIRINVDHIKPRRQFPELELDKNNLQVLCEDCNAGKGSWDQTDWRGI